MWYNRHMIKQNRFQTLNESLESENLLDSWNITKTLSYGETFSYTYDDGSKYGHYVSITRFDDGTYERPVHYKR